MTCSDLIQRIIFLSLTGPGIVGNFLIIVKYVHILAKGHEKKSINLIIIQLAISNIMIICTTGVRDMITLIYFNNFLLSEFLCKTVFYLNRVAQSLSICTTCLLSVIQVITISPRNIWWKRFKLCTAWQVLPHLLTFWVFSILISSNLLHYVTAVNSLNRSTMRMYVGYCYMLPATQMVGRLFLCFMALWDLTFQSLMGWGSEYMALHLYKHHKCVRYLQSSRFARYSSAEIRATQNTLILMTCFLFFYWADFIFSFYIGYTMTHIITMSNVKIFPEFGFASLSPFILTGRAVHTAKGCGAH